MTFRRSACTLLVFCSVLIFGLTPVLSDDYPSKPITLIIPLGAGGSHDLNSRVFTSVIPSYLNQAMVVKLMPGAMGQAGTAAAIKAKPDGYTLLFTHNYIDQLQPLLEKLPYDTLKDLKTVCRINYGAGSVVVRADKPWKTLNDMLEYGKNNPGKLVATTGGNWSATMTPVARILTQAGVDATYIPYKGGGPAMQALLAGDGDILLSFPSQAMPLVESGKIRALASAGEKRIWPEVPTLKELGFEVGTMDRVVMAPAGVPENRIKILRDAFAKLNADKTYQRLMNRIGENMEYMDGPDYEKIRIENQEQYKILIKKITGN